MILSFQITTSVLLYRSRFIIQSSRFFFVYLEISQNLFARAKDKSVFDMLSAKDVIIILTGYILSTTSRLLFPLFLGYLVSELLLR